MALCEGQLDTAMPHVKDDNHIAEDDEVKRNGSDGEGSSGQQSANSNSNSHPDGERQDVEIVGSSLPLSVDYRNPLSHFIPPAVEMYAHTSRPDVTSTGSSESPTPLKRKRGRPRIDKTSPEYLAKSAARKHAKEIAATAMNNSGEGSGGEKRKRGRPRIDKTSPEYLARKRAKELALARKAKRQSKRRNTADSNASSSTSEMPREKRKYTKRPGSKIGRPRKDANSSGQPVERVKGKRGRPRKVDLNAPGMNTPNNSTPRKPMEGKIRVRSNLMPMNSEPISLDSDDEPDLGSPQASDSISFDENLRALRHIHEKYANLDRDDVYNAQLLAANCRQHDIVDLSEDDHTTVKDRIEKLEDSSNSDSNSSSSGSGSSSSSSSSSSNSSSSDSDSDSDDGAKQNGNAVPLPSNNAHNNYKNDDDRSFGAWSNKTRSNSDSDSITSRASDRDEVLSNASMSASDNESPDKSFQCHICRRWYSTQVTLKIHRRSHQARSSNAGSGQRSRHSRSRARYSCEECSDTFTRREKLWDHRAEAHRGSMTVRCTVCRKCFEDERDLHTHMNSHSPNERAGRCSECGAVFPRHEALRRHRASAHATAHACSTCGKTFTHAHSLTRHVQNHARQLYRCVVCKASFARADQLALHLNSHLANYKRLKP